METNNQTLLYFYLLALRLVNSAQEVNDVTGTMNRCSSSAKLKSPPKINIIYILQLFKNLFKDVLKNLHKYKHAFYPCDNTDKSNIFTVLATVQSLLSVF